jgi:hypothetical protein
MGKLCGCVLAVVLLFGLSGAVVPAAHAAVVKGTATGTITVDGNGSGSLYGNVQKGGRVESGHVTLDVASAEAEFNTRLRRLEFVGTERAAVRDDYLFKRHTEDPDGTRDPCTDSFYCNEPCTEISDYEERGPAPGRLSFQAAFTNDYINDRFGSDAGVGPEPSSSSADHTPECRGEGAQEHGQAGVIYGGLGFCNSVGSGEGYRPYREVLPPAKPETRMINGEEKVVWIIRGSVSKTCDDYLGAYRSQMTVDLLFVPGAAAEEPDEENDGMGVVCGRAGFNWKTIAKRDMFVDKRERACVFLIGNDVAAEILARAVRTNASFNKVFASTLLSAYQTRATQPGPDESADEALEHAIFIKLQRSWKKLAMAGASAFRAFKGIAWQVRLGEAVGLQAIPLTALFKATQIKKHNACVQVVAQVQGGKLRADASLVYSPSALKHPKADADLTRARTYKVVGGKAQRAYTGLRCTKSGGIGSYKITRRAFRSTEVSDFG